MVQVRFFFRVKKKINKGNVWKIGINSFEVVCKFSGENCFLFIW